MPYRKTKKRLLLYLLLIFLFFSILPSKFKKSIEMNIVRVASPFMSFFSRRTSKVRERIEFYLNAKKIIEENKSLKEQVAFLTSELADKVELEKENNRLHQLLNLKKKFKDYNTIAANVIGRDSLNWKKSLIIDKGWKDGVRLNAPVISINGLAGLVFDVGNYQSKVLLLNDSLAKVGVIVQRTRAMGVVEGIGEKNLRLKYVDRNADIKTGDILITSGLGSVFPKGIRVGVINRVFEDKMHLYKFAEVIPSVDLGKLEEVMVIVSKKYEKRKVNVKNK